MKTVQSDYPQTGANADLTGLWLQPGFVEGIVADGKRFATLEAAYRHIFRRNLEYAILLWNGLPLRFDYRQDIPAIVSPMLGMLAAMQGTETTTSASYAFRTPNMDMIWKVQVKLESIIIRGDWQRINGDYEAALNQVNPIRMSRLAFLCEWKLLLQQLIQAMVDAEAVLTREEVRQQYRRLQELEERIPERGRFYQY